MYRSPGDQKPHPAWGPSGWSCPAERAERPPSLSPHSRQCLGGAMAQTDILLTKEPAPQTVPACQLPCKLYDVARNTGAHTSSGLATSGFRTAKYLLDEWFQNCYARYHQAFADRDQSERQRHESQQLAAETEALAQRTQQDSTRKVGERLQDMHGWKSELQRQVEELVSETELLLAQKQRLERALDATAGPFSIVTDNLQCRERRQHPDLVRDCVEIELLKVWLPHPWSRRPASQLSPGSMTFPVFPPRLGCAEPWCPGTPGSLHSLHTWGYSSTCPGTEGWGARTNWSWGLPSWGQGWNSGCLGGGGRVARSGLPLAWSPQWVLGKAELPARWASQALLGEGHHGLGAPLHGGQGWSLVLFTWPSPRCRVSDVPVPSRLPLGARQGPGHGGIHPGTCAGMMLA